MNKNEYTSIPIESIDRNDTLYRITSVPSALIDENSLQQFGIIAPVIVQRTTGGNLRVVDGFYRLRIADSAGLPDVPALIVAMDDLSCFRYAVSQAVAQGRCSAFDLSDALYKLLNVFNVPIGEILQTYVPLMGFTPMEDMLDKLLGLQSFSAEQRSILERTAIESDKVFILNEIDASIRDDVIHLLAALRPSQNKFRQLVEWIDEIARREDIPVSEVIGDPVVREILDDQVLNSGQKLNRLRDTLFHRRNPSVSGTLNAVDQKIRELKLGNQVKLTVPPYLEGSKMSVELSFQTKQQLQAALERLRAASEKPGFDEILSLVQ